MNPAKAYGIACLCAVFLLVAPLSSVAGERSPTVVELFTSQGCSSCPPADKFLGELAQRSDVLALSFHVDYWDYIGWKDPFASAAYSRRQRDYSKIFGKSYVYTPQMVIHGIAEAPGYNIGDVNHKIERAGLAPDTKVTLSRGQDGGLRVRIAAVPYPVRAAVWLVFFDPRHETKVRRGENRGRTIANYNVVRDLRRIGQWEGRDLTLNVPGSELKSHKAGGAAVFIQAELKGPILGAQRISLAPGN